MNQNKLFALDIETVTQGIRANKYTDNQEYALGNVKDPDKIKAKLEEKRNEARGKHGLKWWLGKIVSVAIVDVFGDTPDAVYYGHDEVEILNHVSEHLRGNCKVIGMCSQSFDYPYMVGRYMANKIEVPRVLKRKYSQLDVNTFFGYSAQSGQRGKLDDYAHGIEYAGKPMHGNAVGKLYQTIIQAELDGDMVAATAAWRQLEKYNLHDSNVVKALATLYYRDASEVE